MLIMLKKTIVLSFLILFLPSCVPTAQSVLSTKHVNPGLELNLTSLNITFALPKVGVVEAQDRTDMIHNRVIKSEMGFQQGLHKVLPAEFEKQGVITNVYKQNGYPQVTPAYIKKAFPKTTDSPILVITPKQAETYTKASWVILYTYFSLYEPTTGHLIWKTYIKTPASEGVRENYDLLAKQTADMLIEQMKKDKLFLIQN